VGLILGIVATTAVATTSAMSAVYASNDGSQQCSDAIIDKNCQNAIDNYKKHKERAFDKDNNDQGQQRTLENLEDKQP
jgi:hypothetical protein